MTKQERIAEITLRLEQIDYSLAGAWRSPHIPTAHLDGERAMLKAELAELQADT